MFVAICAQGIQLVLSSCSSRAMNQLADMQYQSREARYLYIGINRFLAAWCRGHFDDAATWSRRIAEAFCIFILTTLFHHDSYGLLGEMVYALYWEIVQSDAGLDLFEAGEGMC